MEEHVHLLRRIQALREGDEFEDDAIEDLLALAVLSQPASERGEPDDVRTELVGGLLGRAGVRPDADASALQAALNAYFAAKPPEAALVERLRDIVMELIEQGALSKNSSFAAFTGQSRGGVLGGGKGEGQERPEGTIPAGPLAAFSALKSSK